MPRKKKKTKKRLSAKQVLEIETMRSERRNKYLLDRALNNMKEILGIINKKVYSFESLYEASIREINLMRTDLELRQTKGINTTPKQEEREVVWK